MANLKKTDAIASYTNLFITILTALVLVPIIESNVGKNYYGIYQFVFSLTIYVELISLGLGKTVERYVAKYAEEKRKNMEGATVSMALTIYMFTSLLFFIGVGLLNWQFGNIFIFRGTELEIARLSFLVAALNAGLNVPASLFWFHLKGRGRFSFIFNIRTAQAISRVPVFILLLNAGHGIVTLFLVDMILVQSVNLIYALVSIFKYRLSIRLFYFEKTLFKKLFQFTFFMLLGGIAQLLYWNADNIILAIFTDAEIIAEYALSQRLLDYFFRYSVAFSGLFIPLFMQCYVGKDQDQSRALLANLFTQSSRILGILVSFVVVNFIVLGRDFVVLWIGDHFPMTYVYTVIILIPYWLILSQSTGTEMVYVMNKHKIISYIYLGCALVNIAATVYLVQRIGAIGAAMATGITLFLGYFLLANLYYRNLLNMKLGQYYKEVYLKNALVSGFILIYGFLLNQIITQISAVHFIGKGLLLNFVFIPLIYIVLLKSNERKEILHKLSDYKGTIRGMINDRIEEYKRALGSEKGK